jgi:rRNA-processing protein FCF1
MSYTNRQIVADTNFWLLPFEKRMDIFSELNRLSEDAPYILLIPIPVLNELKMFAGQNPAKNKTRAARSALRIVEKMLEEGKAELVMIEDRKPDGAIISICVRRKCWAATADKELGERLKAQKIRVIVPKDGNILGLL